VDARRDGASDPGEKAGGIELQKLYGTRPEKPGRSQQDHAQNHQARRDGECVF
jgi:hypothetical protein